MVMNCPVQITYTSHRRPPRIETPRCLQHVIKFKGADFDWRDHLPTMRFIGLLQHHLVIGEFKMLM